MKTVAIHQPQYLPYLGFFHKLAHCDVFVALDSVPFQKNGLQNRNKIRTSRGWQWITVPIQHSFGQLIREVRVNTQDQWTRKHWGAISQNYARSPYFSDVAPGLRALLERPWDTLCAVNMAMISWAMSALGINTPIIYSSDLAVSGKGTDILVDICKAVGADCYYSGVGGKEYMDLSVFENARIRVEWQDFKAPVYEQLPKETGFLPNLSIIDPIFCCGPQAAGKLL